ncbi:MAG: hypothetical protein Q9221_007355 [Calogaya cf. arnoldii]
MPSKNTICMENPAPSRNAVSSPFLQLPLEIRYMIYGLMLEKTDTMALYPQRLSYSCLPQRPTSRGPTDLNKGPTIDILATNQQIYAEALPVLYADVPHKICLHNHTFILSSPSLGHRQVDPEPPELPKHAEFVRHYEIFTNFSPERQPDSKRINDEGEVNGLKASDAVTTGISASAKALSTLARPIKTLSFKLTCQLDMKFKSTQEALDFWIRILAPYDQLQTRQRRTVSIVNCWGDSCGGGHDDCAELERLLQEHYNKNVQANS